jgi:(4S)-4-hydroxy-5-phosphonooxypentane-2,3-dione isomerase
MLVVHVHVRVRPDDLDAFVNATLDNARASVQEPGVLRFDVMRDQSDPTHIVLVEVYRGAEARAAHRETAHYATWRDTVAPMMAEPRSATVFDPLIPTEPERWAS